MNPSTTSFDWTDIFNAIGHPSIILDRDHRVVVANEASIRLTGLPNNEIIGRYCFEVFHHHDSTSPPSGCPMQKMLQSGALESTDMEIEALGGVFMVSCTPILAADGSLDNVIHIATDITERKEKELQLAKETAFNKLIINQAPEGVCVCHVTETFPYVNFSVWNERMVTITGYSIDEINQSGWYQSLYPDPELQTRAAERMAKMRDGDNLAGEEWHIINKQGDERIVSIWTAPLKQSDCSEHILAFFIDVTEQRKADEKNTQTQRDWENIFLAINDAIIMIDNDFNVVQANKAAATLLRVPLESIVTRKCFESYHGLTHPMPGCSTCETLRTGIYTECEYFESHLNKQLELKAYPWLNGKGKQLGVIHVIRDITEKKYAEMMLLEQKQFTERLIQNATIATFAIDKNHNVVIWNRACEALTGFSEETILSTDHHQKAFYPNDNHPTLADIVLDGDISRLPKLYNHVAQLEHNPSGLKAEGWFTNIGGKDRYLLVEAAPIFGVNKDVITVIETVHDLTDSKTLEEQLIHSQKMESIGHLAGGVAHEFNNILAVIIGYGQMMRQTLEANSRAIMDLDQILAAGERAADLTKGMLTFSRKQHVSKKNLDLNQLVHQTLKSFGRIIGDHIRVLECTSNMPLPINADNSLVVQVLMNLVTNSRDAMPNGGNIEITTARVILQYPIITVHCTIPPGKYAKLVVTDTGSGIDDVILDKIFEPFFTTKEVGKGTGLGLAVAYGIVQQHDGYFTVNSKKEEGTMFEVYFPLLTEDAYSSNEKNISKVLRKGTETILLADDDPTILDLFGNILSELGYSVISAVDGVDAVEKYMANQDKIDLLVFDVQMGRMSGIQAFKEIKLINPSIHVLFVSGFNAEHFAEDNELEQGTELLTKPFKLFDLAEKIRNLLEFDAAPLHKKS